MLSDVMARMTLIGSVKHTWLSRAQARATVGCCGRGCTAEAFRIYGTAGVS